MDFEGIDAHWAWVGIGLILAVLEMLVPGVYLIWLAVAAIATGAIAFVFDLGLPVQIINFVFLSLIAAYSAKRFLRDKPIMSSDPMLNNRMGRLVGRIAVVTTAIDGGKGRVKVGDSEWIARGPDTALGDRVRITGADGTALIVEPIAMIASSDTAEADTP